MRPNRRVVHPNGIEPVSMERHTFRVGVFDAMANPREFDKLNWRKNVRNVDGSEPFKTDSTHPPAHTFAGSASQIARTMARKDVSPKGLGSAIRMIQYFINRGGRRLSASRRRELERAKRILQQRRQTKKRTRHVGA